MISYFTKKNVKLRLKYSKLEKLMIKVLDDNNIESVIYSEKAFYCLFYDEKMSQLKNLLEIFNEFDMQFKNKIDVYMCEINKLDLTKQYFQMSALPAVVFMKRGVPYGNIAGPVSKAKYQQIAKDAIMQIMEETK